MLKTLLFSLAFCFGFALHFLGAGALFSLFARLLFFLNALSLKLALTDDRLLSLGWFLCFHLRALDVSALTTNFHGHIAPSATLTGLQRASALALKSDFFSGLGCFTMAALQIREQGLFLLLAHSFVFRLVRKPRLLHLLEQTVHWGAYGICKLFNCYFSHQSLLPKRTSLLALLYFVVLFHVFSHFAIAG